MRVLFVADKLEASSGAAHKVVSMAAEWERNGHRVWLTTARAPIARTIDEVVAKQRAIAPARSLAERIAGEVSFRLLYPHVFARTCARLGIDLIYSRGLPPAPGLKNMIRSVPFVLEINGDVAIEREGRLSRWSHVRSRVIQLGNADGVVFVSRELRDACAPVPARSIVIANPCLPSRAGGAPKPARPTLVMIGSARHAWSGVDQIPKLAALLPDLDFVLIGAELAGPSNLRCYGALPQVEVDQVMSGCTVGIGQLARYRKCIHEASPLKSRNYLTLGLPVIQAYQDTDISEVDGCVLQLPNREDGVIQNLERVREFAWRAFQDPTLSSRALALARGRLSLEAKEADRLAFMESCRAAHAAR
jgi:hypothetical protein